MSLCHEDWPMSCLDGDEAFEVWFLKMVDAVAEGRSRAAARALRELAHLGWVVSYIGTATPTLRQRNDAVFWFTTLDLVASHGKLMEVRKVQCKLARLGWVVSRLSSRSTTDV